MSERPRILFLAHLLPYPLSGGAQIKSHYTLRALASAYDVTMLAFVRSDEERQNIRPLEEFCAGGVETVLIPRSRLRNVRDAARSLLSRRSFWVERDWVPAMRTAVERRLRDDSYAVVHIDHLQMAQYALPRRSGGPRLVLDHHNVESMIVRRIAQNTRILAVRAYAALEWPKLQRYELDVCRQCDRVLTVTEDDATILRSLAPELHNLSPVLIGVDVDTLRPVTRGARPRSLLSIGTMYWPPNVDALHWFYADIYPTIRRQVPDVRLTMIGAKPVASLRRLAESDPSVSVPGWVEDVRPAAAECAAFIVPLLSGSGMRVKILNALAMALPVVSTSVGAEGIAVTPGEDILIADTPAEFSAACARLLDDPVLGARLGAAGRALMERRYSWEAIGARLLAAYREVLAGGPPPRPLSQSWERGGGV